jgi:hypothetical protein
MEKEILRKLEEWIGHEIRFRSWQKKYVPADQPAAIVVATVLMTLDDVIKHLKEIKGDLGYEEDKDKGTDIRRTETQG